MKLTKQHGTVLSDRNLTFAFKLNEILQTKDTIHKKYPSKRQVNLQRTIANIFEECSTCMYSYEFVKEKCQALSYGEKESYLPNLSYFL